MKDLFPVKPIAEILNVDKEKILLFTPITEKQKTLLSDELRRFMQFPKLSTKRGELDAKLHSIHKFMFSDILAIGDTNIETRLANTYIESTIFQTGDKGQSRIKKRNYKCFVNDDWKNPTNKMNLPYHEDGGCAWNCLMAKLQRPEFGIIYTVNKEDIKHFINE